MNLADLDVASFLAQERMDFLDGEQPSLLGKEEVCLLVEGEEET